MLLTLVPPVAAAALRCLGATLRFRTLREAEAQPANETTDGDLYVFWHRALLLAAYRYRNLNIRILISASFDGELIARTVKLLGFVPVRGSSSRGGAAGMLSLSRALEQGRKCAVTADGPRGPRYVAKQGAAAIARHAGDRVGQSPRVSAFYLHAERAWTMRSWDQFVIPKPFSKVDIVWTTPLTATLPDLHDALQTALERSVRLAEAADS